ncbi:hypothetical protein [Aestuariimicrobium ganziense]|uniref:hypothetical protein n=1 Tax=Aestuariimicrobium ganziense TaxID=2773677 RepID=UPI0019445A8E|nr:hypothetical protein [Aestuariimicrobium ganziense]
MGLWPNVLTAQADDSLNQQPSSLPGAEARRTFCWPGNPDPAKLIMNSMLHPADFSGLGGAPPDRTSRG